MTIAFRTTRYVLTMGSCALTAQLLLGAQQPQPSQNPNQPQPRQRPDTPQSRDADQTPSRGQLDAAYILQSLDGTWRVTMQQPGGSSEAGQEITGVATRRWILNDSVLEEKVRMMSDGQGLRDRSQPPTGRDSQQPAVPSANPSRGGPNEELQPPNEPGNAQPQQPDRRSPSRQPGAGQDQNAMGDGFEGLGLFSVDPKTRQIAHVWADSKSKGMVYSLGTIDAASRTITFTNQSGDLKPEADSPVREPKGGVDKTAATEHPSVTLQIISDVEHIVTMRRADATDREGEYRITYRRMTGNDGAPGINENPSRDVNPSAPAQPDPSQPRRPGASGQP